MPLFPRKNDDGVPEDSKAAKWLMQYLKPPERGLRYSTNVEFSQRSNIAKRIFDIVGAISALPLLTPALLVPASIVMALELKRFPFIVQKRFTKNGKTFWMAKLQTMPDIRDNEGNLLPDKLRISPTGNKIKSSRADETPQILHALFGQMSLVGPRPLLVTHKGIEKHMDAYENTKAGITGLAQCAGQNELKDYQIQYLNRLYKSNRTLLADFMICAVTPYCLWRNRNNKTSSDDGQLANAEKPYTTTDPSNSPDHSL